MIVFVYEIVSGGLYDWSAGQASCHLVATGHSGEGADMDNELLVFRHDTGPIPPGWYMVQPPINSPVLGRYAVPLVPFPTTDTFERGGFHLFEPCPGKKLGNRGIAIGRGARECVWSASRDGQRPVFIEVR